MTQTIFIFYSLFVLETTARELFLPTTQRQELEPSRLSLCGCHGPLCNSSAGTGVFMVIVGALLATVIHTLSWIHNSYSTPESPPSQHLSEISRLVIHFLSEILFLTLKPSMTAPYFSVFTTLRVRRLETTNQRTIETIYEQYLNVFYLYALWSWQRVFSVEPSSKMFLYLFIILRMYFQFGESRYILNKYEFIIKIPSFQS